MRPLLLFGSVVRRRVVLVSSLCWLVVVLLLWLGYPGCHGANAAAEWTTTTTSTAPLLRAAAVTTIRRQQQQRQRRGRQKEEQEEQEQEQEPEASVVTTTTTRTTTATTTATATTRKDPVSYYVEDEQVQDNEPILLLLSSQRSVVKIHSGEEEEEEYDHDPPDGAKQKEEGEEDTVDQRPQQQSQSQPQRRRRRQQQGRTTGRRPRWLLADDEDDQEVMGVHITYQELYHAMVFFAAIYVGGKVAHFIKMPALVGEIVVGIVLGPPLLQFVPNPEAFVLLGELGLILLVIEAGIDVDVSSLRLIGTRGVLIAVVGSFLPISLGILLAVIIQSGGGEPINGIECLAAGATFGPTSVGVALSLLRSGGLLNTPVGQLIIAAAVIDDMIALIVLSQLESLNNQDATTSAWTILSPVVSATLFLVVGGWVALLMVPPLIQQWLHPMVPPEHLGKAELACLFAMVLALMPATHVVKASYLMGSFLAGLAFCTSHELHSEFVRQFKRILQWLLRIFFAASIGFQVPIKDFLQAEVLWKGLIFCFALTGKLAVGFMVPNFTQSPAFTDRHLRDCLLTGFSMASEGEFAFVIAVFSVGQGLIHKDLYASVVLAVLLSTIIPPFALRATIGYYNQKAQEQLKALANAELERQHNLDITTTKDDNHGKDDPNNDNNNKNADHANGNEPGTAHTTGDGTVSSTTTTTNLLADGLTASQRRERDLVGSIVNNTAVFLCIQSHSEGRWGLMLALMSTLAKLGLEVIDHRAWHPRGIDTTLVSEIYAKDVLNLRRGGSGGGGGGGAGAPHHRRRSSRGGGTAMSDGSHSDMEETTGFATIQEALEYRLEEIKEALERTINQPDVARVKVQRWYPGVVEQIVEESNHGPLRRHLSLEASLLKEASARLTHKQSVQTQATREKSVDEILGGLSELNLGSGAVSGEAEMIYGTADEPSLAMQKSHSHPGRRGRRKVRSSPVVGGGLFGETTAPMPMPTPGMGRTVGADRRHSAFGGGHHLSDSSGSNNSSDNNNTNNTHNWQYRRGGPSEILPNHALPVSLASGRAEISIDNETYDVRVSTGTLKKLRGAYYQRYQGNRRSGYSRYGYFDGMGNASEDVLDLHIQPTTDDVTDMLHGYIRHGGHAPPLTKIPEVRDPNILGGDTMTGNKTHNNNLDTVDLRTVAEEEPRFEPSSLSSMSYDGNHNHHNNSYSGYNTPGGLIRRSMDLLHIPHSAVSLTRSRSGGSGKHGSASRKLLVRQNGGGVAMYAPIEQQQQQQQKQVDDDDDDDDDVEFHDVDTGEATLFEMPSE